MILNIIKINFFIIFLCYFLKKEYIYLDLKGTGGNSLRFDFATFDDKDSLKYLIEFQGKQHYEPIDYFGGKEKFDKQVEL